MYRQPPSVGGLLWGCEAAARTNNRHHTDHSERQPNCSEVIAGCCSDVAGDWRLASSPPRDLPKCHERHAGAGAGAGAQLYIHNYTHHTLHQVLTVEILMKSHSEQLPSSWSCFVLYCAQLLLMLRAARCSLPSALGRGPQCHVQKHGTRGSKMTTYAPNMTRLAHRGFLQQVPQPCEWTATTHEWVRFRISVCQR